MLPYVLVFALVGALAIISTMAAAPLRAPGILAAIILILFAGLRADSVDYFAYENIFDVMSAADKVDWELRILIGKDPLFGMLVLGTILTGATAQFMFFSSAAISIAVKWRAFERVFESAAVPFFVLLCNYYFLHEFTQIRAGIALALSFIGVLDLVDGRLKRALVWMLVATGFHASVLMLVPFAWLARLPGSKATWAVAATSIVFALGAATLFKYASFVDSRASSQLEDVGTSLTPLFVSTFKFLVLLFIYRGLQADPSRNARLLRVCILLCFASLPLLFGLRGISTTLAFRCYEVLDCFSIFILAEALLRGGFIYRIATLGLCAFSMVVHMYNELLLPYQVVTF